MVFHKGAAGQWRNEMKERYIWRIVRDHGAVKARYGYLPDHVDDIPPLPSLPEDRFPLFTCEAPMSPPGVIHKPVGNEGFDIQR